VGGGALERRGGNGELRLREAAGFGGWWWTGGMGRNARTAAGARAARRGRMRGGLAWVGRWVWWVPSAGGAGRRKKARPFSPGCAVALRPRAYTRGVITGLATRGTK
jgi:hypothetical protein